MEVRETLRVPGSSEGIRKAAEGFDSFWQSHGLPEGGGWPFQVALDEAMSNIVHHGLAGREGTAEIEIEFRLVGAEVEIVLADDAPPFNPLELTEPDTAQTLEDRPVGGLGVALVRKLMDVVEYERREGRNQLRLRRKPLEIE
jgi:serine/threonine-protein kinase RsbW